MLQVVLLYIDLRLSRAVKIGNAPVHPVDQDIITLTVDSLNECEIVTSTRRRWVMNYYITQCTGNSIGWRQDAVEKASTQQKETSGPQLISWGSDELETRCDRESSHPAEGAPRPPINQLGIRRFGDKIR